MTEVLVEQPLASPGSANNTTKYKIEVLKRVILQIIHTVCGFKLSDWHFVASSQGKGQTDKHTDIATYRQNWLRGLFSENRCNF